MECKVLTVSLPNMEEDCDIFRIYKFEISQLSHRIGRGRRATRAQSASHFFHAHAPFMGNIETRISNVNNFPHLDLSTEDTFVWCNICLGKPNFEKMEEKKGKEK